MRPPIPSEIYVPGRYEHVPEWIKRIIRSGGFSDYRVQHFFGLI
jgi:hypothetical protein